MTFVTHAWTWRAQTHRNDTVRASIAASAFLLLLGSCAPQETAIETLIYEAEQIRGLRFVTPPRIERREKQEYVETSVESARAASDLAVAYERATWGRLGYLPRGYDPRSSGEASASWVGAYYNSSENALVLFASPTESPADGTVIHELVHALQDQHFDLDAYAMLASTTDDYLARSAVTEGDANLCELRFALRRDPEPVRAVMAATADPAQASERFFAGGTPALLMAYPGFVYSYGESFVARASSVSDGLAWRSEGVDGLFRERRPETTEDVMRIALGLPTDPRVEVGLTVLPDSIADRYEIDVVDRLGAWHAYLLFRTGANSQVMRDLTLTWDGDQLVTFRPRVRDLRAASPVPVALAWTTAWDDAVSAGFVAAELARVQGATPARGPDEGPYAFVAADGEPMWIERRDSRLAFVKGVPFADLRAIAAAALDDAPAATPAQ